MVVVVVGVEVGVGESLLEVPGFGVWGLGFGEFRV